MARMGEHEKLNLLLQFIHPANRLLFLIREQQKAPLAFLIGGQSENSAKKSLYAVDVM